MNKDALRKQLLDFRRTLTDVQRRIYDAAIFERLTERPEMRNAQTILLYADFRGEVGTGLLIQWGLEQGKRILAPVTVPAERKLIPVSLRSPDDFVSGAYGIREPRLEDEQIVAPEKIDVVIVPGVGFDRHGGRLGYGGGYYDRFLPRLSPQAVKIAIAYDCQVLPEIPLEPHDTPLDLLVTEKGVWPPCT